MMMELMLETGPSSVDYLGKTFLHVDGVKRLSGLTRNCQHGHDVVVPKYAVGCVDLWNVAKKPLRVDLGEHHVVLQVAKAIQEELQRRV